MIKTLIKAHSTTVLSFSNSIAIIVNRRLACEEVSSSTNLVYCLTQYAKKNITEVNSLYGYSIFATRHYIN